MLEGSFVAGEPGSAEGWFPAFEPDPFEPDPFEPDPFEPDPFEPDPFEPDPFEPDPFEPDPIPSIAPTSSSGISAVSLYVTSSPYPI